MRVIWSRTALQNLMDIEEFIARDNPERAKKFINRLISFGDDIKDFPLKGRIVPEFSVKEIREIFEKAYRIVYRVSENQVEILTIFEGHKLFRRENL
ncbi:MAG: type II toxin-antitoxin system RelE/ParE family toxin [Calditrichaeota bacterium]|nr:MAG: type II toxin-antitoxin system RelE/ParE family toxin [Calditrichota bacterium]MBL1204954.1 type II toxin-antitoxin system RelE/ParE family toxin [Calditrichota bacterium]NOG44784.1 type II toxin-antitoxin system RelE/ParE family toxin [Calditrichota bacterium]